MPTVTLEELSNQRRSKIGDCAETKETELDVLQRQRNKGKIEKAKGEGSALMDYAGIILSIIGALEHQELCWHNRLIS